MTADTCTPMAMSVAISEGSWDWVWATLLVVTNLACTVLVVTCLLRHGTAVWTASTVSTASTASTAFSDASTHNMPSTTAPSGHTTPSMNKVTTESSWTRTTSEHATQTIMHYTWYKNDQRFVKLGDTFHGAWKF